MKIKGRYNDISIRNIVISLYRYIDKEDIKNFIFSLFIFLSLILSSVLVLLNLLLSLYH
jgi:hypothetical protein